MESELILLRKNTVSCGDFRKVLLMCLQHFDSKYGSRLYALTAHNYFNCYKRSFNIFTCLSHFKFQFLNCEFLMQ